MYRKKSAGASIYMIVINVIAMVAYGILAYVFLFVNALVEAFNKNGSDLFLLLTLITMAALFALSIVLFVMSIIVKVKLKNQDNPCVKIRVAYIVLMFLAVLFNILVFAFNFANSLVFALFILAGVLYLIPAILVLSDLIKMKKEKNQN